MKSHIWVKFAVASSLALVTGNQAQAASCSFKLVEDVPVVRMTLEEGAVFERNSSLETIWDPSKVKKVEKLNGYKGSVEGLDSRHPGRGVALFFKPAVRASGTIEFPKTCKSRVFSNGFCNVEGTGAPNYGAFKSLDKVTYRSSVKDPHLAYTIYGSLNPTSGDLRVLIGGDLGEYPSFESAGSVVNITMRPGEKTPRSTLNLSGVGDALWYVIGAEDGSQSGPRSGDLEFTCQN